MPLGNIEQRHGRCGFGRDIIGNAGGDTDGECGPVPELARHGDAGAHQGAQLLADSEAEPGAAVFRGGLDRDLLVVLEQFRKVASCNADTGIDDLKLDPVASLARFAADEHRNGAVMGEFGGIAQEVENDLTQLRLVTGDTSQPQALEDEPVAVAAYEGLRRCDDLLAEIREVYRLLRDLNVLGFDFRDIENIIDEGQKMLARGVDRQEVLLLLARCIGIIH